MGANSGTLGVYRHGSAWVAQYVDADGIKRQKRFADKWSAAQWREAAIEGRAEPARPTLRAALSEASIEQVLRARGETGRRADALRGGARWLRRECADLLDVDLTDSTSLRLSLETVLLRRKNSTPDARIVARGWRLVGTWEQRDGALGIVGPLTQVNESCTRGFAACRHRVVVVRGARRGLERRERPVRARVDRHEQHVVVGQPRARPPRDARKVVHAALGELG